MAKHRYQPLAFETLAPSNVTALPISAAIKQVDVIKARAVTVGPIESLSVRVRFDGTDPTSAVGHLLNVGDEMMVEGKRSIDKLRIIATAAGPSSVPVTTFT